MPAADFKQKALVFVLFTGIVILILLLLSIPELSV